DSSREWVRTKVTSPPEAPSQNYSRMLVFVPQRRHQPWRARKETARLCDDIWHICWRWQFWLWEQPCGLKPPVPAAVLTIPICKTTVEICGTTRKICRQIEKISTKIRKIWLRTVRTATAICAT